jgi:hypothetical protein
MVDPQAGWASIAAAAIKVISKSFSVVLMF